MNLNKSNLRDILYILILFIFITIFFFYPIGYIFGISFFDWNGVSQNKSFIGLENYKNFFIDPIALKALKNQILWGIITIFSQMFLGLSNCCLDNIQFVGLPLRSYLLNSHQTIFLLLSRILAVPMRVFFAGCCQV